MQLKCEQASLVLRANTRPGGRPAVVVTIGLLVDAHGQIMPMDQTWAWLTERLGKQPLDSGLKKNRGTFAVHGAAYALTEAQRKGMAVRVRLGEVEKSLHVFPPRHWRKGLLGWTAASDGVIGCVPLILENTYGGNQWPDNPQGMGYVSDSATAEGVRLAPLEVASAAVVEPGERPATASFLPLPPQHTERRRFLGSLDAQWVARHAPYLPADTDPRWFDEVAQDQCHSAYWRGDEAWSADGMHPTQAQVGGRLPGLRPRLFVAFTDPNLAVSEAALNLDTVWLFPADQHVLLLYRTELAVNDLDAEDIATLALGIEQAQEPRLEQHLWIERLLPGTAKPVVEAEAAAMPPVVVPAVPDLSATIASLQAASDKLHDEVAQAYADGLAHSKRLAARMGLPFNPGEPAFAPKVDYATVLKTPPAPSAPFDGDALRAGIEAEIAKAKDAAMRHSRDVLQRMGMDVEKTLQQAEQDMLRAKPVDIKATMARLNLPKAEQERMLHQLSEVDAQQKAVEAQVDQQIGALNAALAANKLHFPEPGLPTLPAIPGSLTRATLEARYAAGECLRNLQVQGLDLRGIELGKADLQGTVFDECQLQGARLAGSDLARCQFIDCDLSEAELANACLAQALLVRVNLRKASLPGSDLLGMRAQQCDLAEIDGTSANLQETQLQQCSLAKATLTESSLARGRLTGCDLSDAGLGKANLHKAQLRDCSLATVDLRAANLSKASLSKVSGRDVNLSDSNLRNVRVGDGSVLQAALLNNADLSDASVQDCNLNQASLRGARLNDALLKQCDLSDTDGLQVIAQNAYLISCDLSRAQWPGANLLNSRLRKVCLAQADLSGSNLHGVHSEGAHGQSVRLDHALMTRCRLKEDLAHA